MTATFSYRGSRCCRHAGQDSVGGNYDGIPSWTVTRSVAQWFKLQVGSGGHSYSSHGRIYDPAASNPYWYHYPFLNVNTAGDALLGYSGSKATEYIGAFYQGRKAGNWSRPYLLQAGRGAWTSDRWGDYSATSMDPSDDSFWTIQEYADPVPDPPWGTWITQVKVSP